MWITASASGHRTTGQTRDRPTPVVMVAAGTGTEEVPSGTWSWLLRPEGSLPPGASEHLSSPQALLRRSHPNISLSGPEALAVNGCDL